MQAIAHLTYGGGNCPRFFEAVEKDLGVAADLARDFLLEAIHDLRVDQEIGWGGHVPFWASPDLSASLREEGWESVGPMNEDQEPWFLCLYRGDRFLFLSYATPAEAVEAYPTPW